MKLATLQDGSPTAVVLPFGDRIEIEMRDRRVAAFAILRA